MSTSTARGAVALACRTGARLVGVLVLGCMGVGNRLALAQDSAGGTTDVSPEKSRTLPSAGATSASAVGEPSDTTPTLRLGQAPPLDPAASSARSRQAEQQAQAEAEAFCQHAHAAGRSESAQLRSPWVGGSASTLQRGELTQGSGSVALRMRAGLGFSVSDWQRAGLMEQRADAACALYRTETANRAREGSLEALGVEGWRAEVLTLQTALETSQQLVTRSSAALQRGLRTVGQHLRTLRAERALEEQLAAAELELARTASATPPSSVGPQGLAQLAASAAALEQAEGALRRNRALQITLEAGYDELVGVEQPLPLYGQVTARFRPGYFWQQRADQESARAQAATARLKMASRLSDHVSAVREAQQRRRVLALERGRLNQFIAALQEQNHALLGSDSSEAQFMAEQLWFELQSRTAELHRYDAYLSSLDRWLARQPQTSGY